ncbi:MAG: hypothetical protein GXP58_03315, partial [Deltaproteobacteria bacterium]|nr:hypothetical protein [Deltaproteobacteria bacterium]
MAWTPKGKILFWTAMLLLSVIVTFHGLLHCGFITFDDPDYVTKNPMVQQGLTWAGVQWAFTTGTAA